MEHLRTILETIEGCDIPEGDYLTIANALKKVSEALPTNNVPQPRPQTAVFVPYNETRIRRYFENDDHRVWVFPEHADNIAILMEIIEDGGDGNSMDFHLNYKLIKLLKPEFREMFLSSNSNYSKAYRKFKLMKVCEWKNTLYNYSKCKYSTEYVPNSISTKNNHTLKVEVFSSKNAIHPSHTFYAQTHLVSLGRSSSVVRMAKMYMANMNLSNGFLWLDDIPISMDNNNGGYWNEAPPRMVVSGITSHTREKQRTYEYMDFTYKFKFTYVNKMNGA